MEHLQRKPSQTNEKIIKAHNEQQMILQALDDFLPQKMRNLKQGFKNRKEQSFSTTRFSNSCQNPKKKLTVLKQNL